MSDSPSTMSVADQPISDSTASTSDSLCLEAVWFQRGQKRATVQILPSCTLAQLRAQIQEKFPELDSDMYRFVYDGKVVPQAGSALLSECSFRNNTKLLVLPDTFLKFEFDPSFCGDYISLSPNHRSVQLDSANERWYSTRGRLIDSASSSLTRGVHHWEVVIDCTRSGLIFVGVCTSQHERNRWIGADSHGWGYLGNKQLWANGEMQGPYGEEFGSGDVIGCTLDMDARTLSFRKNGRSLGVAFTNLPDNLFPAFSLFSSGDCIAVSNNNFGNRSYPYADRSNLVTLKTYRNNRVEIDLSRNACEPFNLFPGDKVIDKALSSEAVVVGVGIAPERFKNFIFLWHQNRPGVGGWSLGEVGVRVERLECADKSKPVRELLSSILNDDGCRWSAPPEVPVFQHGLPRSNDAAVPVPAPPAVDEPQQHDDESEHDEDGDEDDEELYIDEDQSYHSDD